MGTGIDTEKMRTENRGRGFGGLFLPRAGDVSPYVATHETISPSTRGSDHILPS